MLEFSESSSNEVNSLVSSESTPIKKDDKIWEKFDLEERVHSSTRDCDVRSNSVSKVHQLCVIITEAEGESSKEESQKIDRQVDKEKERKKEKEKVHVSAGEWRMIKSAINYGTEIPEGSRREVLMGYQYALYQHRKKLREERDMIFQDSEDYWDDYSEDSE
jgi:hypothetical protein